MSTSSGKIQGPGGGEKKGDAGPCIVMAAETHSHGHGHSLPIDLAAAHRSQNIVTVPSNPHNSGLVQLRPVRTFAPGTVTAMSGAATGSPVGGVGGTLMSGKIIGVGGLGSYSHAHNVAVSTGASLNPTAVTSTPSSGPIISVNRAGQNLTILPARIAQTAVATVTGGSSPGISTLQFARGIIGNVRAAGSPGQSITVTPLNTANFGTSIRLAGTVNNGSWIQTSGSQSTNFNSMIRPATIQVGRAVRPVEASKVIHIPQHGPMQHHVAQIQMVDNKGSIIKPSLTSTPIVRGTIHPAGSTAGGTPITFPFTLRASIPTLHRPPISNSPTNPQVQKVITQPAHGPPIQLLTAPKLSQSQLQGITPIPKLNPVCLTISSQANQTSINAVPAPAVAIAPRPGLSGANLIVTPSIVTSSSGQPITKMYPISREHVTPTDHGVALTITNSSIMSTTGATFSLTGAPSAILKTHSLPSGTSSMQLQVSQGSHHIVQVQTPQGVQAGVSPGTVLTKNNPIPGLPQNAVAAGTSSVAAGTGYFMDHKNLNVSVLHSPGSLHPISADKRQIGLNIGSSFPGVDNKVPAVSLGPSPLSFSSGLQQLVPATTSYSHSFVQPVTIGPVSSSVANVNHQSMIPGTSTSVNPHVSVFTTPVSSKHITPQGPVTITMAMSDLCGPTSYGIAPLSQPSSILIPPKSMVATPLSTPSILSATLSMNGPNPSGAVASSSTPSSSLSITATPSTTSAVATTTVVTTCISTPAQSPSQSQTTKSTLSPRPSILRKREAGSDVHNAPLRAQRNLALNFAGNVSGVANSLTSLSTSIVTGVPTASASISASAAVAAAATANKENNLSTSSSSTITTLGLGPISSLNFPPTTNSSILKKEFQPPNEESSWQSCSSNSSSGSTTLSTTSETAEIQLQQLQMQQSVTDLNIGLGNSASVTLGPLVSSSSTVPRGSGISLETSSSFASNHNGMPRSGSNILSGGARGRTISSSKAQIKDIERLKGKAKDDSVSPRKKPRKQQLTTSDLLESASPEISFYQGKKFKKSELMDPKLFEGFTEKLKESLTEVPPAEHVAYYVKKPHISLINSNKIIPRPTVNHFTRYTDVKAKEERRPNINDLANQRHVHERISGWKLVHLTSQLDKIVGLEVNVVSDFNSILTQIDAKVGPNCAIRDLNRIQELLKGNIQRCKVIRDQMSDSRSQVGKIAEHKSRVRAVINKFASRRPAKKRVAGT